LPVQTLTFPRWRGNSALFFSLFRFFSLSLSLSFSLSFSLSLSLSLCTRIVSVCSRESAGPLIRVLADLTQVSTLLGGGRRCACRQHTHSMSMISRTVTSGARSLFAARIRKGSAPVRPSRPAKKNLESCRYYQCKKRHTSGETRATENIFLTIFTIVDIYRQRQ